MGKPILKQLITSLRLTNINDKVHSRVMFSNRILSLNRQTDRTPVLLYTGETPHIVTPTDPLVWTSAAKQGKKNVERIIKYCQNMHFTLASVLNVKCLVRDFRSFE